MSWPALARPAEQPRGNGAARTKPIELDLAVRIIVAFLIVVRLFTESVPVLPRIFNAIDLVAVPILACVWIMAVSVGRVSATVQHGRSIIVAIVVFLAVAAISSSVNFETHWFGSLLFVFGLLVPILFYLILINSHLDQQFVNVMVNMLMMLLWINIVLSIIDVVRNFGQGGHDIVFGTFGVNQNQLAYFLILMVSFLIAKWRYEKMALSDMVACGSAFIIFLVARFQSLWFVFIGATSFVFLFSQQLHKRFGQFAVIVVSLSVISSIALSNLDAFDTGTTLSQVFTYFDELGKVELIRNVPAVMESSPWAYLIGVGPATFNSRAFRSIAILPSIGASSNTDVSGAIVEPFFTSTLSSQYIVPYLQRGRFFLSGTNTDAPFTSWVSIPVEVGFIGAIAFFGIYAIVIVSLIRSLRIATGREATLAQTALVGMVMLLGISVFDNYLEVTRYTLLTWLLVALWYIQSQAGASPTWRPEQGTRGRRQ